MISRHEQVRSTTHNNTGKKEIPSDIRADVLESVRLKRFFVVYVPDGFVGFDIVMGHLSYDFFFYRLRTTFPQAMRPLTEEETRILFEKLAK